MPVNSMRGKYAIGEKFNGWTILESPQTTLHKILCRCDCGREVVRKAEHVFSGASKKFRTCSSREISTKHGGTSKNGKSRIYRIWDAMRRRCSPNNTDIESKRLYYDTGIRVCEEWNTDFVNFRDWSLKNGYEEKLTIDRYPNPHGNYEPSNCRWVSMKEQNRNHRDSTYFEAFGESKLAIEWSEDVRCLVEYSTLIARLRKKWPPELAITTPSGTRENYNIRKTFSQAALMGHCDPGMINKIYEHVSDNEEHLRKALQD
jgi:hypothetical protein